MSRLGAVSYQDYQPSGGSWGTTPQRPAVVPPAAPAQQAPPVPAPAPAPSMPVPGAYPAPRPLFVERPGSVGTSVAMTVSASLEWVVLVGFLWLLARTRDEVIPTNVQPDSAVYHLLERLDLFLSYYGWLPVLGVPLVASILALQLFSRRPWVRIAYTAWGLLTIGLGIWLFRAHATMMTTAALFIVADVSMTWTPAVTRWLASRPGSRS